MPAESTAEIRVVHGDARRLAGVRAASVHLIVTSPPYPMIPLWDAAFRSLGAEDYAAMHRILDQAWKAAYRVLVPGGILAVNIGDALRSVAGEFGLWPNHARVIESASRLGFRPLPYLLWKKPTNRPNAFLGSGFLPPNAYVTLDCEYILLFRKGRLRRLLPHDPARLRSRYTREERDRWFSQMWSDVRGERQGPAGARTGAFPSEIPRRLIRMFSVEGETVLDPFAGTGTTLWQAAELGRRAIGFERDPEIYTRLKARARQVLRSRPRPSAGPATGAPGERSPR